MTDQSTPDPIGPDPIERDLADLAERFDPPAVALADDVRRGRRRVGRQRLAIAGGAVATAVVLTIGAVLVPGAGDDAAVGPSGDGVSPTAVETPTPSSSPSSSPSPTRRETETPSEPAAPDTTEPAVPDELDPFDMPPTDTAMMVALRRAVAGHLDPSGRHIGEREIRQANSSGSSDGTGWTAIVQKIGWTNPGEEGQGLISVGVSTAFDVDCGGHYDGYEPTTCTESDLAGLTVTRVSSPEEGDSIVYQRPDGYVTSIATDTLFGNNSLVAVSGIDVTDAQLAAVLTDPALDIPGQPAARTLDVLPGTRLRDAARAVLGDSITGFETWTGSANGTWWADVRSPDGVVAEVLLSNDVGNTEVGGPCDEDYATRCETRTFEGRTVRIDHRLDETGGGYDVTYDGPRRPIWVVVDENSDGWVPLGVDEAVRLATEASLQR